VWRKLTRVNVVDERRTKLVEYRKNTMLTELWHLRVAEMISS